MNSRASNRLVRKWVTFLAALLVSAALFGIILAQGHVSGVEFSPTHFQRRSFSFYEIPLIKQQITPVRRTSSPHAALNFLRTKSLIKTMSRTPVQWDLVNLSRGLTGVSLSDAELLLTPLDLMVNDTSYWKIWSNDHPKHAQLLWPIVQKLAIRDLYIFIPALFELAQQEEDFQVFQSAIHQHLQNEYSHLVEDLRSQSRNELAEQVLSEALSDYPASESLSNLQPVSTPR